MERERELVYNRPNGTQKDQLSGTNRRDEVGFILSSSAAGQMIKINTVNGAAAGPSIVYRLIYIYNRDL